MTNPRHSGPISTVLRAVLIAVGTALGFGLIYALALAAIWIPGERSLQLELQSPNGGVLKALPDVGRGFFESDARFVSVRRSTHQLSIAVPTVARKVALELAGNHPETAIEKVWMRAGGGAVLLHSAPSTRVVLDALPPLRAEIPAFSHAICGALALGVVLPLILLRRFRARIRDCCVRGTRLGALGSFVSASLVWALFAAALTALATATDVYHVLVRRIDNPQYWPISIFDPVRPTTRALAVATVLFLSVVGVYRLCRRRPPALLYVVLGMASLLIGNGLHGWETGYVVPTAGDPMYLPDAAAIENAKEFLRDFTERQLSLRTHSRTHPPGAVLLYYFLLRLGLAPGAMSLVLGLGSLAAVSACFFAIVRARVGTEAAGRALGLLLFVPAVQIYFISSVDAVICACFTATLGAFMHSDRRVRSVGTPVFLVSSMFLTFGALFLWLALPLYEILVRRSLRGCLRTAGVAIGCYALLDVATGFNWLESLGKAAKQENPHGFSLFSNPGGYLFTRLEGICEILLFASPLLAVAWWREHRSCAGRDELRAASLVRVVTLALMLASGAFKTGETARACLFIYPLLVLPLGRLLTDSARHVVREREALLSALVLQSLVMQLWGDYYW